MHRPSYAGVRIFLPPSCTSTKALMPVRRARVWEPWYIGTHCGQCGSVYRGCPHHMPWVCIGAMYFVILHIYNKSIPNSLDGLWKCVCHGGRNLTSTAPSMKPTSIVDTTYSGEVTSQSCRYIPPSLVGTTPESPHNHQTPSSPQDSLNFQLLPFIVWSMPLT